MYIFSRILRHVWGEFLVYVGNKMTLNNFNSDSTGVSDTHAMVNSHFIFVKKYNMQEGGDMGVYVYV